MTNNNHLKASNLIAYILHKLGGKCDYMKMLKLMYFIDFENYYRYKKPITDETYYNQKYGPVANYSYSELFEAGANDNLFKNDLTTKTISEPNQDFDPNFTIRDIQLIDEILFKYSKLSGYELSILSHNDEPWMITVNGEKIEFDYVFERDGSIEDDGELFSTEESTSTKNKIMN